jgi:hypothetical protein
MFSSFSCQLQQEAAAAAQNSSIENTSNLTANSQQPPQQPPNNVSAQSGPGSQSLPQNNQQSMRPISSPNSSSSGSRSMSPAVGKFITASPPLICMNYLLLKEEKKCLWLGSTLLLNCRVWVKGCEVVFFVSHLTPPPSRL